MQLKLTALAILSSSLLVAAQDLTVQVGAAPTAPGGFFQYIPPSFTATKGSTITFQFTGAPGNHTVTQSSFTDPCTPLQGGFDSGFVFIPPANVSTPPTWSLTITDDTKPIYFFCQQLLPSPHCSSGMVGAINAGDNFAAFQTTAKAFKGNPDQAVGGLVGQGASASAVPGPITGGASFYGGSGSTATGPAKTGTTSGSSAAATTTGSSGGGGGYGGSTGKSGALSLSANSLLVSMAGALLGGAFVLL